jgi:hypothetical protein
VSSDDLRRQIELAIKRVDQSWVNIDRLKKSLRLGQFPLITRRARKVPSWETLRKRLDALATADSELLSKVKAELRKTI